VSPTGGRGLRRALIVLAVVTVALLARVGLAGSGPRTHVKWEIEPEDRRVSEVFTTLERRGLAAALDSLEHRASQDSAVLRGAHQLVHALGRRALIASGGNAAVLAQCRPIFGSGCYHGVVEAFLGLGRPIDMAELRQMCVAISEQKRTGALYECAHGLGHGLLGADGLDLDTTLAHCDALDRPNLVSACHEGTFMEAISSAVADGEGHGSHSHGSAHVPHTGRLTIDRDDVYSPCNRYSGAYGEACWLFQGFLILRNVDFEAGRALRVCQAAPAGHADRCAQSIGHQLAGLFQRNDAWVIEQCGKGDAEPAARCASGAALALVLMDWSGERANRYCASVPDSWRETCIATAGEALARGS
jgi:hypothetical protein